MEVNILEIIKHRYPFLLVDRVLEYEYMKTSKVLKNVSFNEPWVQGHYPEKPIMPGVLLIEAMGQASSFLLIDSNYKYNGEKPKYGYLVKIEKTKFINPVHPGDQLIIEAKLVSKVNNYITVNVIANVEEVCVAKSTLSYVLQEENHEL